MEIMSKGGGYTAASVEGRLSVASEQKKVPGHVPGTKKEKKTESPANCQLAALDTRAPRRVNSF